MYGHEIFVGDKIGFNDSRSKKFPFWIYGEVGKDYFKSVFGGSYCQSTDLFNGCVKITEEEFEKIKKSDEDSKNFGVGDEVVVVEYTPAKNRYPKVLEIYTFDEGKENEHKRAKLSTGGDYAIRNLRKKDILIYYNIKEFVPHG
jgi:hypothetical protein